MEQLGSGGPNPCGDSVKKMSTHFLSLVNGWIWSNWGLQANIHVETVLRKRVLIFLPAGWDGVKPIGKGCEENEYSFS